MISGLDLSLPQAAQSRHMLQMQAQEQHQQNMMGGTKAETPEYQLVVNSDNFLDFPGFTSPCILARQQRLSENSAAANPWRQAIPFQL